MGALGYAVGYAAGAAFGALAAPATPTRAPRGRYYTTGSIAPRSMIAGDLEPDMLLQIFEPDLGTHTMRPLDLSEAEIVQLRWRKPSGAVVLRDLVVQAATLGQVVMVWGAGDTALAGQHKAQVVITWAGGEIQTAPSDGSTFSWTINPVLS